MKAVDIVSFVAGAGVYLPEVENFWRLGDLTALRVDGKERFYRANYERGILLYTLVARYRPHTVLEFGTGRGYGCLCMAWAMDDLRIPGEIYTIDMVGQDQAIKWPIDRGSGPGIEFLTRAAVWAEAAPQAWLSRINVLTGYAGQVMKRWSGPCVDMAFIDGGHGYEAVRHDYYSMLDAAGPSYGILFDDYGPHPGFGVRDLVDQEVAPCYDPVLIYTDRRWPGTVQAGVTNPEYGMVWFHTDQTGNDDSEDGVEHRAALLRRYRREESWRMLRNRLGRAVRRWRRTR